MGAGREIGGEGAAGAGWVRPGAVVDGGYCEVSLIEVSRTKAEEAEEAGSTTACCGRRMMTYREWNASQ